MAYKFQLGAFTASGSLEQEGTLSCDTSLTIDTTTLTTAELGVLDGVTAGTAAASKALVVDSNKDIGTIRNLTIDGTFSDGNYTFDTAGNVSSLGTVGCGAITSTGESSFGSLVPSSADGGALGSASKEWSDLYLATGGKIYYGDSQELSLSANAAGTGLILESDKDSTGDYPILTLRLSSSTPADNDVISSFRSRGYNDNEQDTQFAEIDFRALDVSDGTEDGSIRFFATVNGTTSQILDISDSTAGAVSVAGDFIPTTDSARDLGTSALQWAEAHIDHGYIDAITATGTSTLTTVDINGGAIDATAIGAATPSTAKFTTVSASSTLEAVGATILGSTLNVTGAATFASTIGCGAVTSTGASSMGSLNVAGTLACDTSFTLDSVVINATEIGYLDSVTAGTAAASKALVLDSDGKIATITQLTASYISGVSGQFTELSVAANSLTVGDTVLSETELGVLDGFTDTAIAANADSIVFYDATNSKFRRDLLSDYATAIASTGISAGSGVLSITPAQTAITSVLNDALKLGRGDGNDYVDFGSDDVIDFGIDNSVVAKINAGAISGSAGLQAGGNITLHGNIDVDAAQALTIGATVGANNLTLGAASSTVVVAGNLTVSGTTTTVSSTTIEITGSFLFDGTTPGGSKTTLAVVNPTQNRTINLADSAGTLVPFATPPAAAKQLTVTPTELNIIDGDATVNAGVTIADGDGFVLNDGGTMKQITASTVKSYAKRQVVAVLDNTGTGSVGFNYFASLAGAEECALPASPTVGDIVYIKAAGNCSTTNTITINGLGSHTIDGQSAVVLESPNAALGFLYAVADKWRIF